MDKLFLSPPHMSGKEQDYIAEVFASNYIAPLGTFVDRFEAAVCEATGASYALATNSATAALHLALRVAGVGRGDVVLASSFTFIGSVDAIVYQGATPMFVDSDASWNLSPALLEQAIAVAPKKPKALIVTHLYGQPADMPAIVDICNAHGITLIEDAAESLGASIGGRQTGTWGDMGVFSFNGNKILTTSGGGMLVSRRQEWIGKARFYATQAKEDMPYYEHREVGYNYRLSNILAAVGVAQMEVLNARVARKREIFARYVKRLGDVKEITFMPEIEGARGNRWLTTLTFASADPMRIMRLLETHRIESRLLWKPMHLQPVFRDAPRVVDGTSEALFARGLCLPSGTQMRDEDIDRVAELIKEALR